MCWNIKQSTMSEICSTTWKCYGEETTRRRKRIDDGQLAFLCESTAKGDIAISVHWIAFYWNVSQSFSRRFNREFKLEHFCIPHFSDGFDHESEIPSNSQIKILWTFSFCSTKVQILKSHFVVAVTYWIVFHMWIIYIGEGCIYSPFLIKHPQQLRSYLENVSQYPQLKSSTITDRMCTNKHGSSHFVFEIFRKTGVLAFKDRNRTSESF